MKHIPVRQTVFATAFIVAALDGAALAADERPRAEGLQSRALASTPLSPTTELAGAELTIAPGFSAPSHHHNATLFVYVLEGEIRSRLNDGPIVLYRTGDSWVEPEGTEHSFFENASKTKRARFLVVRVAPRRSPA